MKSSSPSVKIWLFRLLAFIGTPLLFFAVLELGLTLVQVGGDNRLFIHDSDAGTITFSQVGFENWLRPRKLMQEKVKEQTGRTLWRHPAVLEEPKQAGTLRIFCLGASTTQGFPLYEIEAAFPEVLKQQLKETLPERKIEVLNLGISGIGTSIIEELLKEVLPLQPDAVILYAGHNEFAGYLGTTSKAGLSSRQFLVSTHLFLARFRSYDALQDLLFKTVLRGRDPGEKNLISFLPTEASLVPGDPVFAKTLANYKTHIRQMIHACRRQNVPFILCTTAANLEDFPPLASFHRQSLPLAKQNLFLNHFHRGLAAIHQESYPEAVTALTEALALSPYYAGIHFYLGKALRGMGHHGEAHEHLQKARDLDGVKMRAPRAFNQALRKIAASENTYLADCAEVLARQTEPLLPGKNLFYEHVHPGPEGHLQMTMTILQQLASISELSIPPVKTFAARTPVSPVNDWASRTMVYNLTRDFPFRPVHATPRPSAPQELQPFLGHFHLIPPHVMHLVYARILAVKNQVQEARQEAEYALQIQPDYHRASEFLNEINQAGPAFAGNQNDLWQDVLKLYEQKLKSGKARASYAITLGYLHSLLGQESRARDLYQEALSLDPGSYQAAFNLAKSWQGSGNLAKAHEYFLQAQANHPGDIQIPYQIAFLYKKENKMEEAESWMQKIAKQENTAVSWYNLGVFYMEQNREVKAEKAFLRALDRDPAYAKALYQRGLLALKRKRTGEASQFLKQSIAARPGFFPGYQKLAELAIKENLPVIARDQYLQCLRHHPDHLDAGMNLGNLYLQEGLLAQAANLYQAFLVMYPRDSRLHANLGAVYLQQEKVEQAKRSYEKAIELDPSDALALFNLATLYYQQKDTPRAIETLKRGLRFRPNDPVARRLLSQWEKEVDSPLQDSES